MAGEAGERARIDFYSESCQWRSGLYGQPKVAIITDAGGMQRYGEWLDSKGAGLAVGDQLIISKRELKRKDQSDVGGDVWKQPVELLAEASMPGTAEVSGMM